MRYSACINKHLNFHFIIIIIVRNGWYLFAHFYFKYSAVKCDISRLCQFMHVGPCLFVMQTSKVYHILDEKEKSNFQCVSIYTHRFDFNHSAAAFNVYIKWYILKVAIQYSKLI